MINYFTVDELKCKCCGVYEFNEKTLNKLNRLRYTLGHPIVINSGYRCESYNNAIGATQTHATGQAVDIKISGEKAYTLIREAIRLGFTGIGLRQKGAYKSRFIHLDTLSDEPKRPRSHIWTY